MIADIKVTNDKPLPVVAVVVAGLAPPKLNPPASAAVVPSCSPPAGVGILLCVVDVPNVNPPPVEAAGVPPNENPTIYVCDLV